LADIPFDTPKESSARLRGLRLLVFGGNILKTARNIDIIPQTILSLITEPCRNRSVLRFIEKQAPTNGDTGI